MLRVVVVPIRLGVDGGRVSKQATRTEMEMLRLGGWGPVGEVQPFVGASEVDAHRVLWMPTRGAAQLGV